MALRGRENLREESFFFVTTTVINHIRVFSFPECCDSLLSNIKHYQRRYNFEILAYVIMPSHLHWIVKVDREKGSISEIMRDIKKYSAWDIMEVLKNLQRHDYIKIFEENAKCYNDRNRKFWMKRFDDQVIRNNKILWTKLKYIHNNPVKVGLVNRPEDFNYSSARNYLHQDHSRIYVNTQMLGVIIK